MTTSPTLAAPSVMAPLAGLPAARPLLRRFDAVADGVAHQVQHGIEHALDEELVDLGVLPAHFELDVLAGVAGEVAHDERHAPEDLAHRHEPDAHHAFAQIPQLPLDGERVFSWTARHSTEGRAARRARAHRRAARGQ